MRPRCKSIYFCVDFRVDAFRFSSEPRCQNNFRRLRYSSPSPDYSLCHFRHLAEWLPIDSAHRYRSCADSRSFVAIFMLIRRWMVLGRFACYAESLSPSSPRPLPPSRCFRTGCRVLVEYDETGFMLQPWYKDVFEAWLGFTMSRATWRSRSCARVRWARRRFKLPRTLWLRDTVELPSRSEEDLQSIFVQRVFAVARHQPSLCKPRAELRAMHEW